MEKYRVIIGEFGVAGSGSPVNTCILIYMAYSGANGEIIEEKGRVLIPCTVEEYRSYQKTIKNYTVLQVAANYTAQTANTTPYFDKAALLDINTPPTAAEKAFLEEAQKPCVFTHPNLGEFKLNKRVDWFEGSLHIGKKAIRVTLDNKNCVETLEKIHKNIDDFIKKAELYAAENLLESGNDWCYDAFEGESDDFTPMTTQDFIEKISLESISLSEGGEFTLWYSDGDIFWGHVICVSGNTAEGFKDAGIEG